MRPARDRFLIVSVLSRARFDAHLFATNLTDDDERALIAFLKRL
jgi:hypothetical protein